MNQQFSPSGDRPDNGLLWLVGLLVVLLFGVLVNALLHDADDSNPMATAATKAETIPGAHLSLKVRYHVEGEAETIDGHGGGAYNARTGRSRTFLTLPVSTEPATTRSVGDESDVYLRAPTLDTALPPGKRWTKFETMLGYFTVAAFSTNGGVQSMLAALAATEETEELGEETVRGEPTTRYKGTAAVNREVEVLREAGKAKLADRPEALAEKIPEEVQVEAWVDERGLPRRIRVVQPLPQAVNGSALTMDMTMELFDFGAEPKIELPPPKAVLDYAPVTRAELQLLNGEGNAALIAERPAPLAKADFRRRGLALCARIRDEVASVSARAAKALGHLKPGVPLSRLSPVESLATARRWSAHLTGPIARLEKRILRPFAALGPPATVAAPYRQLLQRFAIDAEAREAQARALEAGAFNVFSQAEDEFFTDNGAEQEALLRRVGLDGCFTG